jgi:aspartate carbamoyltransferase catalytic subunit
VINAGDGSHEHPTQGLLDILCLAEAHDRPDFNLRGLRIAIVGDIINSRVARSAVAGMRALGADVVCVGPPNLAPRSLEDLGCRITHDFDSEIPDADAIMMLRVQFERHERSGMIESLESYRAGYALTPEREARMRAGAVVMHPGPMNRGVEIDSEVADSPRSLVLPQVSRGVAVRMAVLATLCE